MARIISTSEYNLAVSRPDLLNAQSMTEAFKYHFDVAPILQTGKIRRIDARIPRETYTDEDLRRMHLMGKSLIQAFPGIVMVAFTQFTDEAYDFFGINPRLNNAIYISPTLSQETCPYVYSQHTIYLQDSLLLMPSVNVAKNPYLQISNEGCWSIDYGKIWMLAIRAQETYLSSYIYSPRNDFDGRKREQFINNRGTASVYIQHEKDHLDGWDCSTSPRTELIDPFNAKSKFWRIVNHESTIESFNNLVRLGKQEFLVHRNGKNIIIDKHGEFVRLFPSQRTFKDNLIRKYRYF